MCNEEQSIPPCPPYDELVSSSSYISSRRGGSDQSSFPASSAAALRERAIRHPEIDGRLPARLTLPA